MTGQNHAPRDAIAKTDLWVPVDATGADFYAMGRRFGSQAGVLHGVHEATGQPFAKAEGAGCFDPHALRWHRLQQETPQGTDDNRLAVQVVNDFDADYDDARAGDAPYGQPEFFLSLNRSTRESDTRGRSALPSSHRRITDSEDGRYALALTCGSVPLTPAEGPDVSVEAEELGPTGLPVGIAFREGGTTTGSHGAVTQRQPSVSIGGVTYFGQGCVDAAKEALARGGDLGDASRWASAAAFGRPRPALEGAPAGATRERTPPPPPDVNPLGGVPLLDHPAGYVWSRAGVVGLLGTLVCPEGAGGSYFFGREGTPIGPLPLRHDAQVTMGPDLVGRMVFVKADAADVPDGQGKPIKGELWADTSRANQDTELGKETLQWRPVLRVNADLPPSRPPPQDPPPWLQPEEDEDEDDEDDEEGMPGGPKPQPGGGPKPPPPPGGPGERSGADEDADGPTFGRLGGDFVPLPRRPGKGGDGELGPVRRPGSQVRDYEGTGEPCPNSTAGMLLSADGLRTRAEPPTVGRGPPARRVAGGWIEYSGHPALTVVDGGLVVGGVEAPIPLGLPTPPGGGVVVDPAPDELPQGRRAPGDAPGRVPLGLPAGDAGHGGFGFLPPFGGDRGVPHGAAERAERREREERVRRAREAQDRREQEAIDRLKQLEEQAREAGRTRRADRLRRAREHQERRRDARRERSRQREEARARRRAEREQRRQERAAKKAEAERRRVEEQARRSRAREDARRRRPPTRPQGGYMIDVTDGDDVGRLPGGLSDEGVRLLDEDRARAERARESAFGDWNVANRPLPFFGASGGPRSIEGWAHLATYSVQALQRVVTGAFGGPSHLAANLGVVHRNAPGNPPCGSRIGAHWTAMPDEPALVVERGCSAALTVHSTLEAPAGRAVLGRSGGVLEVVREHRGEGEVVDRRPLVLLENDRGAAPGAVKADLLSDLGRRFFVDHCGRVSAPALKAGFTPDHCSGPALQVARLDPETRQPVEVHVVVERDGVLQARSGARVRGQLALDEGAALDLTGPGGGRFRLQAQDGALTLTGLDGAGMPVGARLALTPDGVVVQGTLRATGPVTAPAFKVG